MTEIDGFLEEIQKQMVDQVHIVNYSDGAACNNVVNDNYVNSNGWITVNGDGIITTTTGTAIDPSCVPPYTPSTGGITWGPYTPTPTPESSRVIQATPPRLEDIFVEIAKVIQKKGNISEVRDILDRHKLKVVDHDGEVIFDSEWDSKLKKLDL